MKELLFTYNWNNKLYNKAFTSIRLSERFEVGDEVKILIQIKKGEIQAQGTAKVIAYKTFKLNQLNDFIAYLDTGYSVEECKQIIIRMNSKFKRDLEIADFRLYLFKYI